MVPEEHNYAKAYSRVENGAKRVPAYADKASTYFSHQPATTQQQFNQPGISVVPLSNTKVGWM